MIFVEKADTNARVLERAINAATRPIADMIAERMVLLEEVEDVSFPIIEREIRQLVDALHAIEIVFEACIREYKNTAHCSEKALIELKKRMLYELR